MKTTFKTLAALLLSAVLAGCAATGGKPQDAAGVQPSQEQGSSTASSYPYDGAGNLSGQTAGGPGPASVERVVYFDFDSVEIRPDARPIVEAHARYLIENSGTTAILEGHTDERGTREYNIGLGERRNEAVRRLMAVYGVAPQQIRTISYGEEQPAVAGQSEVDYSLNRRVEITY